MNREEDIIKLIQQMCDDDREEEVVRMIDNLPDEERTYKIVGLQARTLSNLAGMIRSGYAESELNPDDLDRRALSILADTAEEGKDDPNWWCRNGYTRMGLNMEAEAIPFFEHVMTLIPDDPETQEFWSDVPEAIENCKKTVEFLEHPTLREPPYIKKRSVMIAVSRVDDFTADMQAFRNRLGDIAGLESLEFEDVSQNTETNTIEHVHGQFCGEPFDMEIDRLEAFNASGMFISSYFNKQDLELIGQERPGYGIDIRFGTANPLAWLHLQLKIATALVPKLLAIYDLSSQQALSEAYVVSTARSSSGPHASFAYSIASESNEQGSDTWLYTNGLARFGLPDIEIMHSDANHSACHRKLIEAVASYMLWHQAPETQQTMRPDVPFAIMTGNVPLYIRLLPWNEAIKDGQKDKATPGSIRTRLKKMNANSCVIFAYENEDAMAADAYQPLWMKDDFLTNDRADDLRLLHCEEERKFAHDCSNEYFWLPEHVAKRTPEKAWFKFDLTNDEGEVEAVWTRLISYTDRHNFEVEIDYTPLALPYEQGDRLRFVDEHDVKLISWMVETEQSNINPGNIYILDAEPSIKRELGIE